MAGSRKIWVDDEFYNYINSKIPQDPTEKDKIKKRKCKKRRVSDDTSGFYSFPDATREIMKLIKKEWQQK
jgi:hypothetical protein